MLKQGKGLYAGLGFGQTTLSASHTFDDGTIGSTSANINYNFIGKIGLKYGRRVYFRTELGYAAVAFPSTIVFNATNNGKTQTYSADLPPINFPFIFNLGFGFGFGK